MGPRNGWGEGPTADPAGREAVRAAEQTVSDAWISQLLVAEHEASVEAAECLRACGRLAERLVALKESGDTVKIGELREHLERADRRSADAMADYDGVRDLLAQELEGWASTTRVRIAASRADRGRGDG
jgi:hypothetical protein